MSRRLFVLLPLFLILAVNQKSAAQTCSPGNANRHSQSACRTPAMTSTRLSIYRSPPTIPPKLTSFRFGTTASSAGRIPSARLISFSRLRAMALTELPLLRTTYPAVGSIAR